MPIAIERIVVQATPEDKRTIVDKANRLEIPVSELMRRSALAYEATTDDEIEALADAARHAAERAGAAIDDALAFIEASNGRLAAMEPAAKYVVERVEAPAAARAATGRRASPRRSGTGTASKAARPPRKSRKA